MGKAFFWLVITFFLSLLVLSGFGFAEIYHLGGLWALIPTLSAFLLVVIFAVLIGWKLGISIKYGVDKAMAKIDEIVKKVKATIAELKEMSLKDVLSAIWKACKDKNKDKNKDKSKK